MCQTFIKCEDLSKYIIKCQIYVIIVESRQIIRYRNKEDNLTKNLCKRLILRNILTQSNIRSGYKSATYRTTLFGFEILFIAFSLYVLFGLELDKFKLPYPK